MFIFGRAMPTGRSRRFSRIRPTGKPTRYTRSTRRSCKIWSRLFSRAARRFRCLLSQTGKRKCVADARARNSPATACRLRNEMRNLSPDNVTEALIRVFDDTPDPRLKEIMRTLVRYLHNYAREVRLTPDEWSFAMDALLRAGKISDARRNEFI